MEGYSPFVTKAGFFMRKNLSKKPRIFYKLKMLLLLLLLLLKHIFGFHKVQIRFFTLELKNKNEKYLENIYFY